MELLAQSRVMYESLDFDDTGGRVGRAIDRAASVLDRCVNLGLFEPFDPAKVKIEFHRYTMNQGAFTIFYDNEWARRACSKNGRLLNTAKSAWLSSIKHCDLLK